MIRYSFFSFLSGLLFALGLSVSGMTEPGKVIDLPLLGGAVLFGIGWGLGGFCPGPAMALIFTGKPNVLLFAGSMILGMVIADQLRPLLSGKTKHFLNQGFWKTGNPAKKLEPATATGTSSKSN